MEFYNNIDGKENYHIIVVDKGDSRCIYGERWWNAGINYPSWHHTEDSGAIPGEISGIEEEEGILVTKLSTEEIKIILEKNGFELEPEE